MTDLSYDTEAAVITELAREAQRFNTTYVPDTNSVHVNVLRTGEHLQVNALERYDRAPRRPRANTAVGDVGSFAALMSMAQHQGSVMFADLDRARISAVINFHGWCDHRIVLELSPSEQFRRWSAYNGVLMAQAEFAELIEDSIADIVAPPAADLLELAQSFQAIKNVEFESGKRLASGAVRFRYIETVDARAGTAGDLTVPETFTLHLPVWRGGAVVAVTAKLRYSIARTGLQLGFKILHLEDVLSAAFGDVVRSIGEVLPAEDNSYTIVRGRPPLSIDPLT